MKPLLTTLFALSPGMVLAADIASVNFEAIEDDLREFYLAKPENAKLRENYNAARESEKSFHAAIEEKINGKKPIDVASLAPKLGSMDRFQLEREIKSALKKELYLIVSGLGLKYELIYDSSNSGTVIYAKSQVDDVTTLVKQAIIDLGKKK